MCRKGRYDLKKRGISLCLVFCLVLFLLFPVQAEESIEMAPPATISAGYAVMDAQTGQVYIEKNGNTPMYPASITKILTLALFYEKTGGRDDGVMTVRQSTLDAMETGASSIALQPGEIIGQKDAVMATALMSANDAANCIGEYTAGSIPAFADLMNQKAAELGCQNTHFVNPSGLHDPQHYTTALDMAEITRYAISVPGVLEAISTESYVMQPTNLQPEKRLFGTGHSMYVTSAYTYEGTIGGKTGWTPEAHHTMVTIAERDGRRLICVVMNSEHKGEKYQDTIALLDYCFDNFTQVEYPGEEIPPLTLFVQREGRRIGEVTAAAPVCTMALHKSVPLQDVVWRYENVPKELKPGEVPELKIIFDLKGELPCMENDLPEYPMAVSGMEKYVEEMGDYIIHEPKESASLPWWAWMLIVPGGLFLLLFGIRCYNLHKRKLRHRARMLARQRAIQAQTARRAVPPPAQWRGSRMNPPGQKIDYEFYRDGKKIRRR